MKMVEVSSSNIAAIGYDKAKKVLHVTFVGGGTYAYFKVPCSVHQSFMDAPSKGTFFYEEIKGIYDYEKVTE